MTGAYKSEDRASYEGERGPSWRDVWIAQRELEELCEVKVDINVRTTMSADKQWCMYVELRFDGKLLPGYGAGWGKGYGNAAKTMPAACFTLLTRVYHHFEKASIAERRFEILNIKADRQRS